MKPFWRLGLILGGLCLLSMVVLLGLQRRTPAQGYWFLFVSGIDGQIYRQWIDPNTQRALSPHQVTTSTGIKQQLSTYENWVVFSAFNQNTYDIFRIRLDGSDLQNLTRREAWDQMPRWSPDGDWIAFASDADHSFELYRMRANGADLERLTENSAHDSMPVWSPDSRFLLYQSSMDDNPELYILDLETRKSRRLTNNPTYDGQADWSPNGQHILWVSDRQDDNNFHIYRMNADGSQMIRITDPSLQEGFYDPRWSPDGDWIAFWGGHPGKFTLHITRPDGSAEWIVSESSHFLAPAWMPFQDMKWQPFSLILLSLGMLGFGLLSA